MSNTDLDAVATRRAAVARNLAELEIARSKLDTENHELEVTERVLNHLADLEPPLASRDLVDQTPAIGVVEALWFAGHGGSPLLTRMRDATRRLFS